MPQEEALETLLLASVLEMEDKEMRSVSSMSEAISQKRCGLGFKHIGNRMSHVVSQKRGASRHHPCHDTTLVSTKNRLKDEGCVCVAGIWLCVCGWCLSPDKGFFSFHKRLLAHRLTPILSRQMHLFFSCAVSPHVAEFNVNSI